MPSRSDLRKSRYTYLRSLGYSVADARRLRDTSGENIRQTVSSTESYLESIRPQDRTRAQRERLESILEARRAESQTPHETRRTIESKPNRSRNWAKWSKRTGDGFPPEFERQIREFNDSPGRTPFSSYGYRVMYMLYVEGLSLSESLRYARRMEGRDT